MPKSPALFWDIGLDGNPSLSHTTYKSKAIASSKRKFKDIRFGVGDLPGDAEAYLQNGLEAFIILGDERKSRFPSRAFFLSDWWDLPI